MYIWYDLFLESANPNGTIRELLHCLELDPFREDLEVVHFLEASSLRDGLQEEDSKSWNLTPNGLFLCQILLLFPN